MKFRQAVAEHELKLPRDVLDAAHKALSDELGSYAAGQGVRGGLCRDTNQGASRGPRAFPGVSRRRGDDERMKFFAQEMVPVLRGHLEQAEKLRR